MGPDRHRGFCAAVEKSNFFVFGAFGGKQGGIEGWIVKLRRAGVVVQIGTGENEGSLSLVELEDSVAGWTGGQLGGGFVSASESELGEAAVGGAVAAGKGVGDVDDGAAWVGVVAIGVCGGGGGRLGVRRR